MLFLVHWNQVISEFSFPRSARLPLMRVLSLLELLLPCHTWHTLNKVSRQCCNLLSYMGCLPVNYWTAGHIMEFLEIWSCYNLGLHPWLIALLVVCCGDIQKFSPWSYNWSQRKFLNADQDPLYGFMKYCMRALRLTNPGQR